jgi:hypothetical protein
MGLNLSGGALVVEFDHPRDDLRGAELACASFLAPAIGIRTTARWRNTSSDTTAGR